MIRVWVMIGLVVAVLGALVLQQQQKVGQLKEQLVATERALEQTTQAMQQLDQMYRAADQQLVINRRQHQQINQQLRGQIDALRSELAAAVCAAADLPNAAADRLRAITSATSDRDTASGTGAAD